jgi:hypothetical protein
VSQQARDETATPSYYQGKLYLMVPVDLQELSDLQDWAEEHRKPLGDLAASTLLEEAHR